MDVALQHIFNDLQLQLEKDDGRFATGLMDVIHMLRMAPVTDLVHQGVKDRLEALAAVYPAPGTLPPHADADTYGIYCQINNKLHPWLFGKSLPQGVQEIGDSLESVPSPDSQRGANTHAVPDVLRGASSQQMVDSVESVPSPVDDIPDALEEATKNSGGTGEFAPTPPIVRALLAARASSAQQSDDAIMEEALAAGTARVQDHQGDEPGTAGLPSETTTVAVTFLIKIPGYPGLSRMHREYVLVPRGAPSPTVELQISEGGPGEQEPDSLAVVAEEIQDLAELEVRLTQHDSDS